LGKGSEFEGKLTFEGQVRIDGKFSGQIVTKDVLTVGEGAKRERRHQRRRSSSSAAPSRASIRAHQLVELHPPARVKGTIETPAMSMEKGVIFEGNTKMGETVVAKMTPLTPAPGTK
jgi:cytoskeletal protein CcmA (bactofilin family)